MDGYDPAAEDVGQPSGASEGPPLRLEAVSTTRPTRTLPGEAGQLEATVVLVQVRWLLLDAAEQLRLRAMAEGLMSSGHPLALGAELAAHEAALLTPFGGDDWYGPEQVPAEALDALAAAEALTRTLPVEAFPAGMSALVVQVCDLLAQAAAMPPLQAEHPTGAPRGAR